MATTDQRARTRITAQLRALRFDAGALSLNLTATVGRRGGIEVERLTGPDRLREWCLGVGVELRAADQTAEFVVALRGLREAAYDVLTATLHNRRPAAASVVSINAAAAIATPPPRLDGTRVVAPELTGDELRSLIARDLLDVLTMRVRECDSDVCRMIYLDKPGGRPRRWCAMRMCGNQAKAEQHRSKVNAGFGSSQPG